MSKNPCLVVLAAGMGSRYGSLKQVDKFGPSGEAIMDYTIYDAIETGFKKIVFVIRESMESEFKTTFFDKLSSKIHVEYVFQELDILPEGFSVPDNRKKPWGTAHAVMTAASRINEPFVLVNADDFYGRNSLKTIYDHLLAVDDSKLDACMVGFILENTLSEHGRVSRGVCSVSEKNSLLGITERTHIYQNKNGNPFYVENDLSTDLTGKEIVSMNLMGFTSKVFQLMESMFIDFLKKEGQKPNSEYYIPSVLNEVRNQGIEVPVLISDEEWFGVTYKEDKSVAKQRLMNLVDKGVYPSKLWAHEP